MIKMRHIVAFAATAALSGAALGYTAGAGITNSPHDLSGTTTATNEICVFCHAPHTNQNAAGELLWNRQASTQVYTMYSSPTLDATLPGSPTGSAKLCLSCHDGSIAVDSFGVDGNGNPINTGGQFVSGHAKVGPDLSNDHPVSFTYDAALASTDGELADPTAANSWATGATIASAVLEGGTTLQCASCHDVHNSEAAALKLLRKDNTGSALCLTCHTK